MSTLLISNHFIVTSFQNLQFFYTSFICEIREICGFLDSKTEKFSVKSGKFSSVRTQFGSFAAPKIRLQGCVTGSWRRAAGTFWHVLAPRGAHWFAVARKIIGDIIDQTPTKPRSQSKNVHFPVEKGYILRDSTQ